MGWEFPILSSRLSSYLESNRAPTEEDVKKILDIKTSVGAVFTQSRDSSGADGPTTDGYETYDAQKCTLALCAIILSPARNIPKEIWGEIFFHCLSTDRNPILNYKEAPLLLTHVSALWKSTALSTPHIWTRIHIPIIQQPLNPLSIGWSTFPDTTTRKCGRITEWLEHAGSLPLKISLSAQYVLRSTAQHPVFPTISLFSRHIQSLDLDFDTPRDVPLTVFPAEELPMLETLTIRSVHLINSSNIKGILSAPSLRNLVTGDVPRYGFPIPSNWSKLVKLSIKDAIDGIVARELLTYCNFLVHCKLVLRLELGDSKGDIPNIHCPHLESLTIIDPPIGPSFDSLLRWLYPPNLRFLQWSFYRNAVSIIRNHVPIENLSSPTTNLAPGFLSRLQNLETLAINPDDFSPEDLRCLSLVPSVKHLLLGNNPRAPAEDPEFHINPISLETNVLKLLSIHSQPAGSPTSNTGFLLPNLENMEYYATLPSDQDILEFIITRMSIDPASTHAPSHRLQKFTAWVDNRDMEMDISLKVRNHAKKLGVPFTLEIRYANKQSTKNSDIPSTTHIDSRSSVMSDIRPCHLNGR